VAEMTQEPPEPLGAAHVAVGDDEDAAADPCAPGRTREVVRMGQRMAAAPAGRRRQVRVDVEEARPGNVTGEVEVAAAAGLAQLPAAVDELVAQAYQLPAGEAGSGTDAGWIT